MNKNPFNTTLKCKKRLQLISDKNFTCFKCSCEECYAGVECERICRKCKSKISITKNTIFENLRFGLVNAFKIAFEYYSSDYNLTSLHVANKYGITQKTAWHYLKKIKANKSYIEQLFTYEKVNISLLSKLDAYLLKKQSTSIS